MALILGVSACGNGDDDTTEPETTTTVAPTTTTGGDTTTTGGDTTTTEAALPGDDFEMGPAAGTLVGVVGVAADDVLFVRTLPDPDADVVGELEPLAADIEHTGRKRLVESGAWWEIVTPEGTGWANSRFLAALGDVEDSTFRLVEAIGAIPTGDSVEAVLDQIEAEYTRLAEEPIPTVVIVDGPHDGDLIEVIMDVTGFGDDALLGERLHIFIADEAGTFGLKSIESTYLCRRGVEAGLCL